MESKNSVTTEKEAWIYELPIVDWSKVGGAAPEIIPFEKEGTYSKLPSADIVVMTWTDAEWSALDHVFVHSNATRSPKDDFSFRTAWREFVNADNVAQGSFALVNIKTAAGETKKVMLVKSGCHLAHKPYITGVTAMVKQIITDASPKQFYSIGTAGGATLEDTLGDVVVTNSGHIQLKEPQNTAHLDYNNTTVTCDWFPSTSKMSEVQEQLFIPLSEVADTYEWDYLLKELHSEFKDSAKLTLADLINQPLEKKNLETPKVKPSKGVPLLTTDYYYIAPGTGNNNYSVLEMDDTVVGHTAQSLGVDFTFVRNISDTVVASETPEKVAIPDAIRNGWSGGIYKKCGLYTSYNGALTAWAAIVG